MMKHPAHWHKMIHFVPNIFWSRYRTPQAALTAAVSARMYANTQTALPFVFPLAIYCGTWNLAEHFLQFTHGRIVIAAEKSFSILSHWSNTEENQYYCKILLPKKPGHWLMTAFVIYWADNPRPAVRVFSFYKLPLFLPVSFVSSHCPTEWVPALLWACLSALCHTSPEDASSGYGENANRHIT